MASQKVQKEIEHWCNHSTLRGKTPLSIRPQVLSTKDQDKEWDKMVNETFKEENILRI